MLICQQFVYKHASQWQSNVMLPVISLFYPEKMFKKNKQYFVSLQVYLSFCLHVKFLISNCYKSVKALLL